MTSRVIFYWCHTTSREPFETGIQRVVRRLAHALGRTGLEVLPLGREDRSGLVEIIGHGSGVFEAVVNAFGATSTLLIPELTTDLVAIGADPICIGQAYGMRSVILVHDLIPLKLSWLYAADVVAAFTGYFESCARADLVLATTRGVAEDLRYFLESKALRVPPITVIPLPAQFGDHPRVVEPKPSRNPQDPLKLVAVSSWERRKNVLALLHAMRRVRSAGRSDIALTLVGRRGADPEFDAEVDAALAETPGVTFAGSLSDTALAALVASCDATVYPSLEEGFGLPVGESLWLGRPCLCHNSSAMAETAPGGGTLMVDMADVDAIAEALVSFAAKPDLLARLSAEARTRRLASWDDYAGAVAELLAA